MRKNKKICPVLLVRHYLKQTASVRKSSKLFLNHQKPHHAVAKDTLSKWVKSTLRKSGIDTTKYTAHSTRAASTSAAARASVDISTIMKAASWTRAGTFKKFYHKEIKTPAFGNTILLGL